MHGDSLVGLAFSTIGVEYPGSSESPIGFTGWRPKWPTKDLKRWFGQLGDSLKVRHIHIPPLWRCLESLNRTPKKSAKKRSISPHQWVEALHSTFIRVGRLSFWRWFAPPKPSYKWALVCQNGTSHRNVGLYFSSQKVYVFGSVPLNEEFKPVQQFNCQWWKVVRPTNLWQGISWSHELYHYILFIIPATKWVHIQAYISQGQTWIFSVY